MNMQYSAAYQVQVQVEVSCREGEERGGDVVAGRRPVTLQLLNLLVNRLNTQDTRKP